MASLDGSRTLRVTFLEDEHHELDGMLLRAGDAQRHVALWSNWGNPVGTLLEWLADIATGRVPARAEIDEEGGSSELDAIPTPDGEILFGIPAFSVGLNRFAVKLPARDLVLAFVEGIEAYARSGTAGWRPFQALEQLKLLLASTPVHNPWLGIENETVDDATFRAATKTLDFLLNYTRPTDYLLVDRAGIPLVEHFLRHVDQRTLGLRFFLLVARIRTLMAGDSAWDDLLAGVKRDRMRGHIVERCDEILEQSDWRELAVKRLQIPDNDRYQRWFLVAFEAARILHLDPQIERTEDGAYRIISEAAGIDRVVRSFGPLPIGGGEVNLGLLWRDGVVPTARFLNPGAWLVARSVPNPQPDLRLGSSFVGPLLTAGVAVLAPALLYLLLRQNAAEAWHSDFGPPLIARVFALLTVGLAVVSVGLATRFSIRAKRGSYLLGALLGVGVGLGVSEALIHGSAVLARLVQGR